MARPATLDRDVKILRHVGRYWLTLRAVLQRLPVFDGRDPSEALRALRESHHLVARTNVIPGGYTYYQLTAKGAQDSGTKSGRAAPLSPVQLEKHLALLWFCYLSKYSARRVEQAELSDHLGEDVPTADHTIDKKTARIFDTHLSDSDTRAALRRLKRRIGQIRKKFPEVQKRMDSRAYGFIVLVTNPKQRQHLNGALHNAKPGLILRRTAVIRVHTVPSFQELGLALKGLDT